MHALEEERHRRHATPLFKAHEHVYVTFAKCALFSFACLLKRACLNASQNAMLIYSHENTCNKQRYIAMWNMHKDVFFDSFDMMHTCMAWEGVPSLDKYFFLATCRSH